MKYYDIATDSFIESTEEKGAVFYFNHCFTYEWNKNNKEVPTFAFVFSFPFFMIKLNLFNKARVITIKIPLCRNRAK